MVRDGGRGFSPLSPSRLLDTRTGLAAPARKREIWEELRLQVAGRGGVPGSGATAVTVNVTATEPEGTGFVTVYPCGSGPPVASNMNFVPGQNVANLVTVPVAANGTICLTSNARTHLLADVAGWFGTVGAGFSPLSPSRLLDTRTGLGAPARKREIWEELRLQVAGRGGVPASGATAVTVNVTATEPEGTGFVTVYPCGSGPPVASNMNFVPGQNVANLVTVPVAANGTICLTSNARTHLLADVAGWFQ